MRKADPELHRRRREEILAAAETCFVQRGFHASSMQDIAAASGVSMGLLYRYFKNKEAIIEAAAQRERDTILVMIDDLPEQGDLGAIWGEAVAFMVAEAARPDQLQLINEVVAEAGRTPKLMQMLRDYDDAIVSAIAAKLERQSGNAAANSRRIAHYIVALVDGLVARHAVGATKGDLRPQDAPALVAAVIRGLGL